MYDLMPTGDLAAFGLIFVAFAGGLIRWLVNNEHRIANLEQSKSDVGTQYALDIVRLEKKIDSLQEKLDAYSQKNSG